MGYDAAQARTVLSGMHPRPAGVCVSDRPVFEAQTPSMDLSVIVPCRDAGATLPALLASLAAQRTRYRFEAVLVDDGSRDGTAELLRRCAGAHPDWQVRFQPGGGAASARNTGLRVSRGRYVAFVDADDAVPENYVEALMTAAERTGAQMAACAWESRTRSGLLLHRTVPQNGADGRAVNGCPWGKAFRRELFAHVLFPEGYWFEDTVLSFLVYPQVTRLATTADCTYVYRSAPGNATRRARGCAKAIDTLYVTELMLAHAPQAWLRSEAGRTLLMDQFYLNHRRVLGLPAACRKALFAVQASYADGQLPRRCASPAYARALCSGRFGLGEMAVRVDGPRKLLARLQSKGE